jgi:outer membrane protein assembly factor BamB
MIRSPLAAAMIAAGLAISPAPAQEARPAVRWPQFRGPNGAGLAPDGMTLPERFGPAEKVVWKTALPAGHSSPCIWGDRIFLTGFDPAAKKLETVALDRRTGEVLWRRPAPTTTFERVHQISNPATATPATDGERVYVYFGSFGLLCYDFAGAEQWKAPLPIPTTRFGSGTSPVLAGDLVLLHAEYAPKAFLLAVDRRTGTTAWKKEFPTGVMEGYATPAVWRHDGLDEVVLHRPGRIAGHDPADGAERWWVDVTSNACSTPVIGDGQLFAVTWMMGGEPADRVKVPTFDELLEKYDKNKDGLISKDEFPGDLSFTKRADTGDVPGADVKIKPFFDQLDVNKDGQISRLEWAMVQMFVNRPVEHGLLAIKPGGHGDVTKSHVLWREKKATRDRVLPGRRDRQGALPRAARAGRGLFRVAGRRRRQGLHRIAEWRGRRARGRGHVQGAGAERPARVNPGDAGPDRRQDLPADRKAPVRIRSPFMTGQVEICLAGFRNQLTVGCQPLGQRHNADPDPGNDWPTGLRRCLPVCGRVFG